MVPEHRETLASLWWRGDNGRQHCGLQGLQVVSHRDPASSYVFHRSTTGKTMWCHINQRADPNALKPQSVIHLPCQSLCSSERGRRRRCIGYTKKKKKKKKQAKQWRFISLKTCSHRNQAFTHLHVHTEWAENHLKAVLWARGCEKPEFDPPSGDKTGTLVMWTYWTLNAGME